MVSLFTSNKKEVAKKSVYIHPCQTPVLIFELIHHYPNPVIFHNGYSQVVIAVVHTILSEYKFECIWLLCHGPY